MERNTDPRLLMLVLAVTDYIEAKNNPPNPFVKGFGRTKNYDQSYDFLVECLTDCEEFFPELEALIEELDFIPEESASNPNEPPTV